MSNHLFSEPLVDCSGVVSSLGLGYMRAETFLGIFSALNCTQILSLMGLEPPPSLHFQQTAAG